MSASDASVTTAPLVEPGLQGRDLSRRYGATQALQSVSIDLALGRVTAIAGENGAGKSTLIRLLTGIEQPDEGVIIRSGRELRLRSRHDATRAGIFCVYQDQPFVPKFEVYRQVFLGYESFFSGRLILRDAPMRSAAGDLLAEFDLPGITPDSRMGELSTAAREVVALLSVVAAARVLEVAHPVILLDEPTSALSAEELALLRRFIETLKERSAIAFVSHRVAEVLEWSDSVVVLRDGRNADLMTRETASAGRIHIAMGGGRTAALEARALPAAEPAPPAVAAAEPSYVIEGLGADGGAGLQSLSVMPGEIVGIAGVEGSGKSELLRICAGLPGTIGPRTVSLVGQTHRRELPRLLRGGLAYLSGDRQAEGVIPRLSISENIAITRRIVAGRKDGLVAWGEEARRAEAVRTRLGVRSASVAARLSSLSGGNQQKVLLGRILEIAPRVLLLDNVTRGVDVGTKESIYALFRDLAADGVALILASDDLEELIALTDRIVVMRDGRLVHAFENSRRDVPAGDVLARMVLDDPLEQSA